MLNIFERIIIYIFIIELEENKVKQYCVNGHGDLTLSVIQRKYSDVKLKNISSGSETVTASYSEQIKPV